MEKQVFYDLKDVWDFMIWCWWNFKSRQLAKMNYILFIVFAFQLIKLPLNITKYKNLDHSAVVQQYRANAFDRYALPSVVLHAPYRRRQSSETTASQQPHRLWGKCETQHSSNQPLRSTCMPRRQSPASFVLKCQETDVDHIGKSPSNRLRFSNDPNTSRWRESL